MNFKYYTADVFTDQIFGGNQLAVIPEANGLTDQEMLSITREFNYSETSFVFPPDDTNNAVRLRIFTPGGEVPFAGHPTVGTAHILTELGVLNLNEGANTVVFEEQIGPVSVNIEMTNGTPKFIQLSAAVEPEIREDVPTKAELAELLGLSLDDISTPEFTPKAVSCGVPFLYVPLKNRAAVARAKVNMSIWETLLKNTWAPHIYVFAEDAERESSNFRVRMFGPGFDIVEDPATGAAAVAFAGYLASHRLEQEGVLQWRIEQGFEMGRPSILDIQARIKDRKIIRTSVGGTAVTVCSGEMSLI